MAIITEITKVQARMKLNNGTDSEGNIKTVTVSLPTLAVTASNAEIAAVAELAEACLTKTIRTLERVDTTQLTNDD